MFLLLLAGAARAADPVEGARPQAAETRYVPDPPGFAVTTWAQGLEVPWSLVFLPDGRALVSERPGRIRVIDREGRVAAAPWARLDVRARGEGGLMGLALHPDFPRQPYVYAMYTSRDDNRVVRLVDHGNAGTLDRAILEGLPSGRFHNGGRIAFGPDRMLYVTAGETFEAELAQDLKSLGGKVLRVTADGAVPPDNPFPGSPIWTYGNRNPQGLAWHPETGDLFESEHGPSGELRLNRRDEVNVLRKGANYGWPLAVCAAGKPGWVDPIVCWTEAATPPGGLAFHGGALYVATLRSQALARITLARDTAGWRATAVDHLFASDSDEGRFGRLRDVVPGPDGALYVLTSNRDGRGDPKAGDDRILRIVPPR